MNHIFLTYIGSQKTVYTGKIIQTSLSSYLKIVHSKNVSLVLNESLSFSLQYCTFSSTTVSSQSLQMPAVKEIILMTILAQFWVLIIIICKKYKCVKLEVVYSTWFLIYLEAFTNGKF